MTIENTVRVLNELLEADPKGTNNLFFLGVVVNKKVCDHPTIQVCRDLTKHKIDQGILRPIGLLNGMIQEKNKVIAMQTNASDTEIIAFVISTLRDGKVTP